MIEDRMPVAADSGAPASDRRQGAARTADPVADHRPGRPASPLAQRGDFDSPPASSPTDRRDADDATFAAELARLDRLKVADEDTVERVARAMYDSDQGWENDAAWIDGAAHAYRRLARAAIAALQPAPGTDSSGQAVQREVDPDACERCGSRDPYECIDGCDCSDCVDGDDAVAGPQRDHDEEGA